MTEPVFGNARFASRALAERLWWTLNCDGDARDRAIRDAAREIDALAERRVARGKMALLRAIGALSWCVGWINAADEGAAAYPERELRAIQGKAEAADRPASPGANGMSSFFRRTKHPVTGNFEDAFWIDDYFGRHRYGVRFPLEERVYRETDHQWEFDDTPSAQEQKR